jgi:hypothetical protein
MSGPEAALRCAAAAERGARYLAVVRVVGDIVGETSGRSAPTGAGCRPWSAAHQP